MPFREAGAHGREARGQPGSRRAGQEGRGLRQPEASQRHPASLGVQGVRGAQIGAPFSAAQRTAAFPHRPGPSASVKAENEGAGWRGEEGAQPVVAENRRTTEMGRPLEKAHRVEPWGRRRASPNDAFSLAPVHLFAAEKPVPGRPPTESPVRDDRPPPTPPAVSPGFLRIV